MARMVVNATVGTSPQPSFGSGTEPNAAIAALVTARNTANDAAYAAVTPKTATEAAIAALEADGALPTQAHVAALRSAWNISSTAISTTSTATNAMSLASAAASVASDVVLIVNSATVLTKNKLK